MEFIIPGSTFSQVMWSPNGKNLLVVLRYSAHLWNYNHKDNVCKPYVLSLTDNKIRTGACAK